MADKISNTQKRLREMLDILNLKQVDICKRCHIEKSSMSNYISGKRQPNRDNLVMISEPYGINPVWLAGYDVPMYLDEIDENLVTEKTILIEMIRNSDDDFAKHLLEYAEFVKKNLNK